MEQLYKDPRTPLRMREGALGAYVDAFAQQLIDEGYAKASGRYALQLVANLGLWLRRRGITAPQLTTEHLDRYLEYRSRCRRHRSGDAAIVRRLFSLLLGQGVVAQRTPIQSTPAERLGDEFRLYLERERRLAPATVFHYLLFARRFLVQCFADGEPRLDGLRGADVVGFVQREAARLHHPKRSKLMTTALRSFLQYAHYRGLVSIDLRSSVPTVASWSMASLPRALSWAEVQRLLARCERHTAVGRRNWAILLLLARLGLRAGEVVGLAFEDLDWKAGELCIPAHGGNSIGYRYPRMSERPWPIICVMRVRPAPRGGCSCACEPRIADSRVRWQFAASFAAHSRAQGWIRPTRARTCCATPWRPKCYGKAPHWPRSGRCYATAARRRR